jgi:hypothetical protein
MAGPGLYLNNIFFWLFFVGLIRFGDYLQYNK